LLIGNWCKRSYISSDKEHEEPYEGRLSRTVLWEGWGEIPLPDPIPCNKNKTKSIKINKKCKLPLRQTQEIEKNIIHTFSIAHLVPVVQQGMDNLFLQNQPRLHRQSPLHQP